MDFHEEFSKSMAAFPCLLGLIFVDPQGESILFEAQGMDQFDVKLAGAKMAILMNAYQWVEAAASTQFIELQYEDRFIFSIKLDRSYNITAIANDHTKKARLKIHLRGMAEKFNSEIF